VAEFVFAGFGKGAAASAAILEVSAMLVHFAEFLAHEADDLHSEYRLVSNEVKKDGGEDEVEGAVGFAVGAEVVGSGAEGCGEADDAARTQNALEDFAAVIGEDRHPGEAVLNDIYAAALGSLTDDDFVSERDDRC
jgi:hypothetical protein